METQYHYDPTVNERVYKVRIALNLSQAQMAEQLGLSKGFFGKIESVKDAPVSRSVAYAICNKYGVRLAYLANGEEPMFEEDAPPPRDPRKEEIVRIYETLPEAYQEMLYEFLTYLSRRKP